MLKTALRPRWLGLLGVLVLVCVAFFQLGRWQMGVAQDRALREALEASRARPVVAVEQLLRPHETFPNHESARTVTATGTFDPSHEHLVPERRLDGEVGYWVITPMRVQASGAWVVVLRGWVADPAAVPPPTPGTVTVTGGLAPGESPYAGPALPAGQLGSVDLTVLVNELPGEIYNAFVFGERQEPTADLGAMRVVPTPSGDVGFNLRNLAYALQWWLFALFAVWMYVRMVRDDARSRETQASTRHTPLDPTTAPQPTKETMTP